MTDDDDFVDQAIGAEVYEVGECEEGKHVVLVKDGVHTVGHARVARPGEPLNPGECILQTEDGRVTGGYSLAAGDGPAQVSTKQYRDNYDAIFGLQLCEFCGAEGRTVASLEADPDQRVCATCHEDPRIPTKAEHVCAWCSRKFDYDPFLAWDWYVCRPCFGELESAQAIRG